VQHLVHFTVQRHVRFLGTLLLSLILCTSLYAQAYWVYGCVLDEEGFLMENVTVTASGVERGTSNDDGKYDIMLHDTATSALTFSAPGYQDVLRSARPTPQGTRVNVNMQPEVQTYRVYGRVTDSRGLPLPGATVLPQGSRSAAVTDSDGRYDLPLRANREIAIRFSFIGYDAVTKTVVPSVQGTRLNVILRAGVALNQAEVEADGTRTSPVQKIDPRMASRVPSVRGTVEDLLIQAPVNFTSELSSAYNVRGGSFDENLVYVNGIEVYRPFLVRAGQQEGLSFPNPDMIQSIRFSAGGFESKYGDRMSSVLDINYRRPQGFAGRASMSLLGAQFQMEDVSENKRWTYNMGMRYRNNGYVLGSLDEAGEYRPVYTDFQSYVTYDPDGYGPWELQALATVAQNKYQFIPQTRETNVGTINEALRLTVYFDGQEVTQYRTGFAALAADRVTPTSRVRFIASAFRTDEEETFDILGGYFLSQLERDPGSDAFGEALGLQGIGYFLNHARNSLQATVLSGSARGSFTWDKEAHFTEWGVQARHEIIDDQLNEWELVDSAGYILPHPQDVIGYGDGDRPFQQILLQDVVRTDNRTTSSRMMAYVQDTWKGDWIDGSEWEIHAGARLHHWTFNKQTVGGPRIHASWKPKWTLGTDSIGNRILRDVVFNLAGGWYWQPAFYREMRDLQGQVNPDIRAQRALHLIAGVNYRFNWHGRPFILNTEAYHKDLASLIPYEVENVRLRYYANNNAVGRATGIDMMLNGEFIDGVQSWMRMSFLRAEEDLTDDGYFDYYNEAGELIVPGFSFDPVATDSTLVEPGFIPRATDQRFSLSMLFQDEMPGAPEYKVLLSIFYGTGLPFGPPDFERYKDTLRLPAYRRVDIGFSRDLFLGERSRLKKDGSDRTKPLEGFVALEVFNLLGIRNTINHTWIQDVTGRRYAIPNYLTARRLNLKFAIRF